MCESKYFYLLKTPLGESLHIGKGDVVKWPKSMLTRLWFWKILDELMPWDIDLRIYRRKLGPIIADYYSVFNWPAKKAVRIRKPKEN